MAVYSPQGIQGTDIVSAASDGSIRGKGRQLLFNDLNFRIVWRYETTKYQQIVKCQKQKPSEDQLY
jgi:hypothetical protein